jgi:hypothetical protein
MVFCPILSGSSNFSYRFSVVARLTGEFASLEEHTDDPDDVILSVLLADGIDFIGSKRRIEPERPMQKLKLPNVSSIS